MRRMTRFERRIALIRNARLLRFPDLTHPLIDATRFPEQFLETPATFSDALLDRICACFARAERGATETPNDIWTELTDANRTFLDDLRARNLPSLRKTFENLHHGPLLVGMGFTAHFIGAKPLFARDYFSLRCRDSVLALAEAVGERGVLSNQQVHLAAYIDAVNADLEPILDALQAALGHSLDMPAVGRPPVAVIGHHRINPDSVRHAYIPYRLRQIVRAPDTAIIEIGGGYGCVARFAHLSGFSDYTIVDLPYVNSIQMAFLAATLGEDKVSGIGEPRAAITLWPSTHKAEAFARPYDCVVNMDSLPEINGDEARAYLTLMHPSAKLFLSVNQESKKAHKNTMTQHRVADLIAECGGFERLHRHPYWMQQGYVEELYRTI